MGMKLAWFITFVFFGLLPYETHGGEPTEQVRATVQRVLALLRDRPSHGIEQELRLAVEQRFDFAEMAKRSLGSQWRRLTPEQEQEFVRLFTNLLERKYLGEIAAYENEKIVFTNERQDGQYAVVESQVVPEGGEAISLDYKLHRRGAEWKIYDVAIEDISLVNNYRSQFNRVIARSSLVDLMERLRQLAIDSASSNGQ
jgi:phospholipid transport system substrate-binding protein